ncbi:hypothetical protein R1flu_024143 [Riccia fluitans]|uniref:Uncharacterized protein n=1 Tax=Riccia fluitans TaxID=41844 RepID=A0ABD1XWZ0_9MARC
MEKVNGEELSKKKPFIVEGDVKREPCYSWIFKVRCLFCGSKFELIPSKRNLEHNLREHLSSEKHRENVKFQLFSSSHGPVHSGVKGQPKKFDPKGLKRQCLLYIPKTMSFRLRCTREDDAAIKRGSRDSLLGIRLDYLPIPELRARA